MIGDLFDSPWKLLIVAAVIVVLFGSAKLPGAARSLGKSMRILKTEIKDLHEDGPEPAETVPAPLAAQPLGVPAQPLTAQPLTAQQTQLEIADLQRKLADLQAATAQPVVQPVQPVR
jgi:sec-independent protein translocase protein TatA